LCRVAGNLPAFGGRQFVGAGRSAFRATQLSERDIGGIPVIRYGIGCLRSRDVADQLGKRNRIATTFFFASAPCTDSLRAADRWLVHLVVSNLA
jgi:hypothetical protein